MESIHHLKAILLVLALCEIKHWSAPFAEACAINSIVAPAGLGALFIKILLEITGLLPNKHAMAPP